MTPSFFLNPSQAGIYYAPLASHPSLEAAAAATGVPIIKLDLRQPATKETTLEDLGTALSFPDWYGVNFDGLHDCLTEPVQPPQTSGQILVICGVESLLSTDPDTALVLLEVFKSATKLRQEQGDPLWVFVDVPMDDIADASTL